MKSSKLIQLLQEIDPTGEVEVCVSNADIYTVQAMPASWDGCLETLIIDESKKPYFCISGIKFHSEGEKIHLRVYEADEFFYAHPDGTADFSELDKHYPAGATRYRENVKSWREKGQADKDELDKQKAERVAKEEE